MAYKKSSETGMFDQEFTLETLSGMGNPLSALKEVLDFEQFRPILEPVFAKENRKSNAGRRGLDPVFMMKVMFLQRLYGLGDKQIVNVITNDQAIQFNRCYNLSHIAEN